MENLDDLIKSIDEYLAESGGGVYSVEYDDGGKEIIRVRLNGGGAGICGGGSYDEKIRGHESDKFYVSTIFLWSLEERADKISCIKKVGEN